MHQIIHMRSSYWVNITESHYYITLNLFISFLVAVICGYNTLALREQLIPLKISVLKISHPKCSLTIVFTQHILQEHNFLIRHRQECIPPPLIMLCICLATSNMVSRNMYMYFSLNLWGHPRHHIKGAGGYLKLFKHHHTWPLVAIASQLHSYVCLKYPCLHQRTQASIVKKSGGSDTWEVLYTLFEITEESWNHRLWWNQKLHLYKPSIHETSYIFNSN